MSKISAYPSECEVLFPPFTWFKVTKINLSSAMLELYVDEVDSNYIDPIIFPTSGTTHPTQNSIIQKIESCTDIQHLKYVLLSYLAKEPHQSGKIEYFFDEYKNHDGPLQEPTKPLSSLDIMGELKESSKTEGTKSTCSNFSPEALEIANSIHSATKYAACNKPPPFVHLPGAQPGPVSGTSLQPVVEASHIQLQQEWKLSMHESTSINGLSLPSPQNPLIVISILKVTIPPEILLPLLYPPLLLV